MSLADIKKLYRQTRDSYRATPNNTEKQVHFVVAGQLMDIARGKPPRPLEPPPPPVTRRLRLVQSNSN
jgi:hypothetical protein